LPQGRKIINICSLMSEMARPTVGPTWPRKRVKTLTKSMAVEWGKHNIQVNASARLLRHAHEQTVGREPQFDS